MNELVEYLISNLQFDFSGDVGAEQLRQFLRDDDGPEARKVLGKLLDDEAVDELLLTLADCLRDHIRSGVTAGHVREQIHLFTES